jgi:hypothetical protein
MGQHVFAEIALTAIGTGVGIATLNVAILAAGDIFRRADRIVGAADRIIVIATCIDHRWLSALKAAREQRYDEQQCNAGSCGVTSHASSFQFSSLPGLTRQSIEIKALLEE